MLELVRQRANGHALHKTDRAHVLIDDAARIRNHEVEHLREVAGRAGGDVTSRGFGEKIPTVKESANVEILIRGSELVDGAREEENHMCVLIDVRRVSEILRIDWIDERVERDSKGAVVFIRESVRWIARIHDHNRPIGDGRNTPGSDERIRAARSRVSVELKKVANLRDSDQ